MRVRALLALFALLWAGCSSGRTAPAAPPAAIHAETAPGTAAAAQGGVSNGGVALLPEPLPTATAISVPAVETARPAPPPAPPDDATTARLRNSPEIQAVLADLERRIEQERQQRGIAGLSVGVVYDQSLIWSRGFGLANVDTQTPATPQTLYRVGSISKLFTDTMLMRLRDDGKLLLDDPIDRYLPEARIPSNFKGAAQPTFRQLASHTGGVPREAPLNYWRTREFPATDALLASLQDTRLIAPPGTAYQYSNLGVAIMGAALERVANQPYRQYVISQILRPLGMNDSGFDVTPSVRDRLAVGPVTTPTAAVSPPLDRFADVGALAPAAALYSSVEDMARFMSLQFRGGPASGAQVLAGPSLEEMRAPDSRGGPSDFAIGWELGGVAGHRTISHPGVIYGFTTQITLVPDTKLGVAVFTNSRTDPARICNEILAALMPAVAQTVAGS